MRGVLDTQLLAEIRRLPARWWTAAAHVFGFGERTAAEEQQSAGKAHEQSLIRDDVREAWMFRSNGLSHSVSPGSAYSARDLRGKPSPVLLTSYPTGDGWHCRTL